MSEGRNTARSLNPCVFHLQKLGLELKCPLCLDLLNKPVLLPCNHIFCKFCVTNSSEFTAKCPSCHHYFMDQEIRPAPYMENIVGLYKSLDATFNSTVLPLLSADAGTPDSILTSADPLRMKLHETAPKGELDNTYTSLANCVDEGIESTKKTKKCGVVNGGVCKEFERQGAFGMALSVDDQISLLDSSLLKKNTITSSPALEELEMNNAVELSPDSSFSAGAAKEAEGQSGDPPCGNGCTEKNTLKRSAGDPLVIPSVGVDHKTDPNNIFHAREPKRQRKLNYGSSVALTQSCGYNQQAISHSNQAAVVNCKMGHELKRDNSVTSSTETYDASNVNENVCALCHSSKITEGTGPILHYADGKEVSRGETTFSRAIPVHSKCIEWTPKVYYVGETIKNLESELARAAKLKCSSCGLKGAALGCFVKSCRRSYHMPCAVEIPNCRWDCNAFLMLCPIHKSIKFPSERSKSERQSLSTQIPSIKKIWSQSPYGEQEWSFCGSALSSEEKCLMVKFATLCGATVFKFWDPNVTHVIAATDAMGACTRTLKVLIAILNGKWVVTMDWVKACLKANCHVDEESYEIKRDNHGDLFGPQGGRFRLISDEPKLFNLLSFYFYGEFAPGYKSNLLDLVREGGGIIVESLKQTDSETLCFKEFSQLYIVYDGNFLQKSMADETNSCFLDLSAEAADFSKENGGRAIPHTLILNSIAEYKCLF